MARTRAIFDWIFGLDPQGSERYKLFYLQSSTVGMSDEALLARQSMEAESETKVHELATTYRSMDQVWWFLNSKHDLYSAGGLIERANDVQPGLQELESDLIRKGYGGTR